MDHIEQRALNRYTVLRELHFHGPLRRGALGTRLGIRKTSVGSIVAELREAGVVRPASPESPRSPVELAGRDFYVTVASLGTDGLAVARVYLDGTVEDHAERPLRAGTRPRTAVATLGKMFGDVQTGRGIRIGAGFVSCGAVDRQEGTVRRAAGLPEWRDVPVRDALQRAAGVEPQMGNDADCQVWCSGWFGRMLVTLRTFLYLSVAGGVAGVLLIEGQDLHASRSGPGEIGHISAGTEGRVCGCGKMDCLETYCSVPAMGREIRAIRPGPAPLVTGSEVMAAVEVDPAARNVVARVARRLAEVLTPAVATVSPEALVLGCSDTRLAETMRPVMQRHFEDELSCLEPRSLPVHVAEATGIAGMKGMAAQVIDAWFRSGETLSAARSRRRTVKRTQAV